MPISAVNNAKSLYSTQKIIVKPTQNVFSKIAHFTYQCMRDASQGISLKNISVIKNHSVKLISQTIEHFSLSNRREHQFLKKHYQYIEKFEHFKKMKFDFTNQNSMGRFFHFVFSTPQKSGEPVLKDLAEILNLKKCFMDLEWTDYKEVNNQSLQAIEIFQFKYVHAQNLPENIASQIIDMPHHPKLYHTYSEIIY